MPSLLLFLLWRNSETSARAASCFRFLDYTQRNNTFGRPPMDEESALRGDIYLTTRNTHKRQTSVPPAGFEPPIPASYRSQTLAWGRSATGIVMSLHRKHFLKGWCFCLLPLRCLAVFCTRKPTTLPSVLSALLTFLSWVCHSLIISCFDGVHVTF